MSFQAAGWAISQQIVKEPTARHVLLVLASYADKLGRSAFPSTDSLQDDTGLSRRTIYRALKVLEASGVIVRGDQSIVAAHIKRADKRPVCYDMVMDSRGVTEAPGVDNHANLARGDAKTPRNKSAECHAGKSGVPSRTQRGVTDDVTGCHTDTQSVLKGNDHPLISQATTSQAASVDNSTPKASAHGARLPADWMLTHGLARWALQEQPTWDAEHVRKVAAAFRDHWIAQPGVKGRKTDWEATWRNWVRKEGPLRVQPAGGAMSAVGGAWWEGDSGTEAQAAKVGITREKDEPTPRLLVRVARASGKGPWIDYVIKRAPTYGEQFYQWAISHIGEALLPVDF